MYIKINNKIYLCTEVDVAREITKIQTQRDNLIRIYQELQQAIQSNGISNP